MQIQLLNDRVKAQLNKFRLKEKFSKQLRFFAVNPFHPGLHTEKLEPKSIGLYSFRIDKKYRAIFRIRNGSAEILHFDFHRGACPRGGSRSILSEAKRSRRTTAQREVRGGLPPRTSHITKHYEK